VDHFEQDATGKWIKTRVRRTRPSNLNTRRIAVDTKQELLEQLREQLYELHKEEDRIGAAISETVEEIAQVRATPAAAYDLSWTGDTEDEEA